MKKKSKVFDTKELVAENGNEHDMWPDIQKTVIGILQDENLANRVEVLEDSREDCTTR